MKKKIEKIIISLTQDTYPTFKDLKNLNLQDDDQIICEYDSLDGWTIEVTRLVEETDEEESKRIERMKITQKMLKQTRYQNYLKLKEEFDNEQNTSNKSSRFAKSTESLYNK